MVSVNTSPFHVSMLRKFNVWYTVKDGNWSDPTVWMSNGSKRHSIPQPGDDVVINHVISLDINPSITTYIRDLIINQNAMLNTVNSWSALTIVIQRNLYNNGTIDFSNGNKAQSMYLYGDYNNVGNLISGTNSIIYFYKDGYQYVPAANYCNLALSSNIPTTKKAAANITTTGDISIIGLATFELSIFDLTCRALTTSGSNNAYPATLSKTGSGSIIFNGLMTLQNNPSALNLTGNPTLEFKAGFSLKNDAIITNFGTGTLNFTTNNQILSLSGTDSFYTHISCSNVNIIGAITITNNANYIIFDGVINGTVSGSTLINNAAMGFSSTAAQMTTGIFTYNNGPSTTIVYAMNGNYTLPFTNYARVYIEGTGTKTANSGTIWSYMKIGNFGPANFSLSTNTVTSGNMDIVNSSIFECNGYDFTAGGYTYVSVGGSKFKKSGLGAIVFIGELQIQSGNAELNLSGNPTIEFRGGLFMKRDGIYNFGTGLITFTTNNQTVRSESFSYPDGSFKYTFTQNIFVLGSITVTYISAMWIVSGTIDGDNSASIFDCRGYLQYQNAAALMATSGLLYANNAPNYIFYNNNGDQDITPGTYYNLTLAGSGVKRLLGDISVKEAYTLTAPATFNSNNFTLTNP